MVRILIHDSNHLNVGTAVIELPHPLGTGQYVGYVNQEGKAYGEGVWVGADGSCLKGTWKDNERHGYCKFLNFRNVLKLFEQATVIL